MILLKNKLSEYENSSKPKIENLACMNEVFSIRYDYELVQDSWSISEPNWQKNGLKLSWENIFKIIAPSFIFENDKFIIGETISNYIKENHNNILNVCINEEDLDTIIIQFLSLKFLEKTNDEDSFFKLSSIGYDYLEQVKTIKTKK